MDTLRFNIDLASGYSSSSQKIRVLSEDWVSRQGFCPSCGNRLAQAPNNSPVFDFYCPACSENFELKSKKNEIGSKIVDGAYQTMLRRVDSDTNPSLFLLNYQPVTWEVRNFIVIPKHFFIDDLIERRKPLLPTARRAGWVGCNILLDRVPNAGKIFLIRDKVVVPRNEVVEAWGQTLFLREEGMRQLKGWILLVMHCIDSLNKTDFRLDEVYAFENVFQQEYPQNRHIKDKIRQQLQFLRDFGYLEFMGRGKYRRTVKSSANSNN